MKRCSCCRKGKSENEFGFKKNNSEYKTCISCRNKGSSSSSSSQPFNTCIPGCVNPSRGLHHVRCPNYISPTNIDHVIQANREIAEREALRNQRNTPAWSVRLDAQIDRAVNDYFNNKKENSLNWKKGFLLKEEAKPPPEPIKQTNDYMNIICTFKDICETLNGYGYRAYTKRDIDLNYEPEDDYLNIRKRICCTNSFFIYEIQYPHNYEDDCFFNHVLSRKLPYVEMQQLYIEIGVSDNVHTLRIPYVNVFKDFVINVKLKHAKRCSICQLKKKCFKSCFRCCDKYCSDCFYKFNDKQIKDCPYCRY